MRLEAAAGFNLPKRREPHIGVPRENILQLLPDAPVPSREDLATKKPLPGAASFRRPTASIHRRTGFRRASGWVSCSAPYVVLRTARLCPRNASAVHRWGGCGFTQTSPTRGTWWRQGIRVSGMRAAMSCSEAISCSLTASPCEIPRSEAACSCGPNDHGSMLVTAPKSTRALK
jgi:hypothetical protein